MGKAQGGYTLIEVSLALLVMSVGLVSVLSVFPVALKWAGQTNANVMAASAARSLLEDLRNEYRFASGTPITANDSFAHARALEDTNENGVYEADEYDADSIRERYGFWMDPFAEPLTSGPELAWPEGWRLYRVEVRVYLVEPDPENPNYKPGFHDLGTFAEIVYLGEAN